MMTNFEKYLRSLFSGNPNPVEEAELYSLLNGGKRVRPALLFSIAEGAGKDPETVYPYAAAIEMIHTYSLIHDDLPAMDNDDFRRGKPSNHVVFGEAEAILAGDALLTKAFETASVPHPEGLSVIRELARAAGDHGMVYGQILDLHNEENPDVTAEILQEIDLHKTGELLSVPLVIGSYLIHQPEDTEELRKIGYKLGLAFQIQDDILDVTATKEELGKSTSDLDNRKSTYVSLWGIDKAKQYAAKLFQEIYSALEKLHFDTEPLYQLIKKIEARQN